MNEPKQQDSQNQFRVVGEDAPKWLTIGFGVVGASIAAVAAWLWIAQEPRSKGEMTSGSVSRVENTVAPARPEARLAPASPTGPSAAPEQGTLTTEQPSGVRGGSPVVAGTIADAPAGPSPPAQTTAAVQAVPENAQARVRRDDCPALVTIPFKFDSAAPDALEIKSGTEGVVDWMNKHREAKVSIQGNTDSAGWDQYNLLLSYRRAKAVAESLSKAGIATQRIVIRAAGSHEPIQGVPSDSGSNRRVTLQVTGIDGCQ